MKLQKMAEQISKELPPKHGFILLAFPFDDNSRLHYVSNCQRQDVIEAMKEFIAKTEGKWATHIMEPKRGEAYD